MPLIKSKSKKAFQENVSKEIDSGKDPKQALAIAYSVKKASGKKPSQMPVSEQVESPEEKHASIVSAVMAKRKKMANGGIVDDNNEEQPNAYYSANEAALKENYDEDFEFLSQPMDSNEIGDEREEMTSNRHNMISSIRSKMKARR